MTGGKHAPGLPKFDPNRGVCTYVFLLFPRALLTYTCPLQVHGSQSIEILKPFPAVSGPGWKIKKRVVGVSENSTSFTLFVARIYLQFLPPESGIILEMESTLVDGQDVPYARLYVRYCLPSLTATRDRHYRAAPSTSARRRQAQTSPSALRARPRASRSLRTASPTGSCATRRPRSRLSPTA